MSILLQSQAMRLAGHRIMILGDVILDEYIFGTATRMSREAPIPVLELIEKRFIPGGAANPAANIVSMGSAALQVGIIGEDHPGEILRDVTAERGIRIEGLLSTAKRPTTVKTRIMAQMGLRFPQQVARIDTLTRNQIDPETEKQLLDFVSGHIADVDAVLMSDYHTGLLTPSLVDAVRGMARSAGVLISADAQGSLEKYAGFDLVKCNADDARTYLRREIEDQAGFGTAAEELFQRLALRRVMVITRGAEGAILADNTGIQHCAARAVSDVYDTVGAGDTAIAVMTLALAAQIDSWEAVMLANYASGIVVRHVGNYAPSLQELLSAIASDPYQI